MAFETGKRGVATVKQSLNTIRLVLSALWGTLSHTVMVVVIIVMAWAFWSYELQGPPLVVHQIWTDDEIVQPGGKLTVKFRSTKTRPCEPDSTYYLTSADYGVRILDGVEGFGPLDTFTLSYQVNIPRDISPGHWSFHERSSYDCGLGRWFVVVTDNVAFTVEEPS